MSRNFCNSHQPCWNIARFELQELSFRLAIVDDSNEGLLVDFQFCTTSSFSQISGLLCPKGLAVKRIKWLVLMFVRAKDAYNL